MIEKIKTSRIVGMLAAVFIATMFLTSSMVVLAQSADEEPNNSFSDAVECYDGDYIRGVLDDTYDTDDYFKISLYEGDYLSVSLSMSGYDFDLFLYDPYEYEVEYSDYSDYYGSIYHYATETGDYYIRVYAASGVADYTLTISVAEGMGGGSDELYVGGPDYVSGDPLATLPTMTVGDGVYWGGVKNVGEEIEDELDTALAEIEDLGFDVNYDINGGIGAYFGIEVAGDSSDINGVTCYDIEITGAIAIDIGLTASVSGSVSEYGYDVSVDGSGNGFVVIEAYLDGHMYLTVDELALAKIDLTFTAEGRGEVHLDADMSMDGIPQSIKADAEMSIDDVQIDFDLAFDPPLDIYQFGTGSLEGEEGIYEGKEWYVPGYDTDVTGSLDAQGTITYDYTVTAPGQPTETDSDTINLATEIGSNDFFETIPGGAPDDYYYYGGGTLFTCVYASGDIFIIETDMGSAFGYGTRQIPDVESMIPSTGFQFDKETGLITGMTMDGEPMTTEVTAAEVEDFADDPLAEVKAETGGHDAGFGAGLLGILLIGVIVIIVVVIVVVMLTRKKAPPQQYPPQQYAQQPPPPPPEYQPQQPDQYQQPPADQYQQPPPPPPPGQ